MKRSLEFEAQKSNFLNSVKNSYNRNRMNPYVKSVELQEDFCLLLTFENGEKRLFDLKPYFKKPVFSRLQNVALFKTARVVSGAVEWQGEIDLSYDTLYLERSL
jgi:uncharacterized protein DUF2442